MGILLNSKLLLAHYSHIRMAAKRAALDSIATRLPDLPVGKPPGFGGDLNQNGNQTGMSETPGVASC